MTSVLMSVLAMLGGVVRSRAALQLEVIALRHQLQVLQRSRPRRLRIGKADRWLWAWLSVAWSGWRTALVIVKPETGMHQPGDKCARFETLTHFVVGEALIGSSLVRLGTRQLAQRGSISRAPRFNHSETSAFSRINGSPEGAGPGKSNAVRRVAQSRRYGDYTTARGSIPLFE